jgi:hypothetical protein
MEDHDEDDELVLEFDSEASGRTAVIADEGDSVWVYLTHPDDSSIERDCWLFNKPTAPTEPESDDYQAEGTPPPVPARFLVAEGPRPLPNERSFRVRWSKDGHAAAVLIDGVPIGVVSADQKRGMSRFLREACPWGRPWDQAELNVLFGDMA